MTTATLPAPVVPSTDDGLVHTYCCDENWSLCGLDITAEPEVAYSDSSDRCVVCAELDERGGPCGVPGCWQ